MQEGGSPNIEILSIDHLIPISVRLKLNGKETAASAFIDYSTETVHVPDSEIVHVGNLEMFKNSVIQFLHDRADREEAEQDALDQEQSRQAYEYYRFQELKQAQEYAGSMGNRDDDDE